MWKKLLIAGIALVGTFSIVYATQYNHEMKAAVSYNAGGNVTGRVNIAPSGVTNANIGMKKGDRVYIGITNPSNNTPLGWQLIHFDQNYPVYNVTSAGADATLSVTLTDSKKTDSAWFAMSTKSIGNVVAFSLPAGQTKPAVFATNADYRFPLNYGTTNQPYLTVQALNKTVTDTRLFKSYDYRTNKELLDMKSTNTTAGAFQYEAKVTVGVIYNRYIYLPDHRTMTTQGGAPSVVLTQGFSLNPQDLVFEVPYFVRVYDSYNRANSSSVGSRVINTSGSLTAIAWNDYSNVRPASMLGMENVVFGVSTGNQSGVAKITHPNLPAGYKNIHTNATGEHLKLRLKDDNLTATTSLYHIVSANNTQVTSASSGSSVFLNASAIIGNDNKGNVNTVSAIIFDDNGIFEYYKPLEPAKGAGLYELDTTGMAVGKYKIGIVNEVYNEKTTAPANSSEITDTISFEILPPLSVTVTQTPQSQSTFEFSKNVGFGDQVAVISNATKYNQVSYTSSGAKPITYTLVTDGPTGHELDYEKFDFGTDSNGNTTIYIIDSNGLQAGEYYFKVHAIDALGDPVGGILTPVKITVNKTTPTISFVDQSKRTEPYVSGKTFTENVTHTNTDSGVLPTYQTNNGIVSASADASGNALITLNTAGTTGDVTVTATLPASANFNATTATKQINVYAGMTDFKFTPSKTPILTTDTMNANYLIGQLSLQNGLASYSYSIDHDPNGNIGDNANGTSFKVDTNSTSNKTMNVYTTGQLTAGTYKVTFKVIDQNNQELYLPVTITITPAGQTGFEFYDYETNATITNGIKEIEYGTSKAKVIASGGLGTGAVSYKIKGGQPNDVIDLDTSDGDITGIHKTGSVIVEATKASDANYSAATIEMTVKIVDGSQSLTFNPPTSKKFVLNDPIPISASLTRMDGTTGTITYVSNDISICTIDDSDTSNVKVIMKAEGECSITASNSDTYYKAVSDTKKINLYGGITGTFVQVIDPLNQGDAKAQAGSSDTIAKVTSLAGGDGTFNLVKMTVTKAGVDVTNMFDIDSTWNITPKQSLTYGDYDFSIEIEDGNQESSIITGTLSIGLETNNSFKITKDSVVITELTTDYVTAQNPKIILGTQGKKGTGAVHFTLVDSVKDPNETDEAISINDTGTITVNRAMTSSDLYYVQAYIDEDKTNGYAKQETPKVRVIVNKSPQSITFDSTVPPSVKYDLNKTFDISATLDRTPGDITYSSTTPSICIVEDSTKPIAKIKDKGTCVIKAENNDQNYVYEAETTSITIYDGMTAGFTQTITPLKQGDSALDPTTNTVIGKITGLAGNQGAVSYGIKVLNHLVDVSSDFKINDDGEVLPVNTIKYGTYDVEITLTDSTGVNGSVKVTGTIVVGLEENNSFKITYKGSPTVSISETYTNAITGMNVGTSGKKGNGQVHYELSDGSHRDPNEAIDAITVNDDGTITVNRATTSDDVYEVYAYVEEDVINGFAKQETSAVPIVITDATMPNMSWLVDGVAATEIHTDYGPNKKIQLGVDQAPNGSTIKYYLVEDGTGKNNGIDVSDVVSVDETTGKVTILHANLASQVGNVLIKAVVSCSGYTDTELTPINVQIDKAEQTNFKFAQSTYTMLNGSGKFSPTLLNGVPHNDGVTYNNKLDCPDGYGDVSVDPNDPSGFVYNVTNINGGTYTLKVKNLGNRDYKSKEASATLRILKAGETLFDVDTDPSSKVITYGDIITILPVDPESATISYEYESQDSSILKQNETDKAIFHGVKAGDTSVKVTRKETGKQDAEVYVLIRVKPKEIQVEIDAQCPYEMLTGEELPTFTVKPFPDGVIINGDVISDPSITIDIQNTNTVGTYPIIVTYPSNDTTKNYKFIQVPCNLVITQDHSEASWYQGYLTSDDKQNAIDLTKWYSEPVSLKSIHPEYDEISRTGKNDWNTFFAISQEGEHQTPLYFRKSSTNAQSDISKETIKLDYTSPVITYITAQNTNTSTFARFMNTLTFHQFYQQGVEVTINAEDQLPAENIQVSGVKEVTYEVNTLKDGKIDQNIKMATASTDEVTITLPNSGEYRICATASDIAGNVGEQNCKDINVKKIDVDVNGDNKPDFNDPDGDGCPDFNIIYKDEQGNWIILNEDSNRDGIPERNIDSDGDGKPDINVDTDDDGRPDVNLLIMTKELWKPTKCVTQHGEQYASGIDLTPIINVDLDIKSLEDVRKAVPDINIDNIGDFKPHLNITNGNSTKPTLNLIDLHEWIPDQDYKKDSFQYDSIGTDKKAQINIDTDGDGLPDVNIDFDGDKVPDINIDTTGDNIPDLNIDSDGDGKPDISVDTNKDGIADENIIKITEWKPEKNGEKDGVSFDTMEIKGKSELEDNGIVVEKPDGTFLPNYAIKVEDVTETKKEEFIKGTSDLIDETQEVKSVYDVKLLKDGIEVQPDGTLKVRIPTPEGVNNPILFMKKEDGTYQKLNVTVENGYLVYETNELGMISVIGEKEEATEPKPNPIEKPTDQVKTETPKPTVQGTYTGNIGGASTGDRTTNIVYLSISFLSAALFISYILRKKFFY